MINLVSILNDTGIPNAGGTFTIDSDSLVRVWSVKPSGSGVLSSNVSITNSEAGPQDGSFFELAYEGGFNYNGNTFTVFGSAIPSHLAGKKLRIFARYYDSWNVAIAIDPAETGIISGDQIIDLTVATADIADNAITLAKLVDFSGQGYLIRGGAAGAPEEFDASTSGNLLIGSGTTVASVAMSGGATITAGGVVTLATITNAMLDSLTRGSLKVGGVGDAVTDVDFKTSGNIGIGDGTDFNSVALSGDATLAANGALTIAAGAVTGSKIAADTVLPSNLTAEARTEVYHIPVSFETGEQCDNRFRIPYDGTISHIYAVATKAIAATDNGTIVAKNNAGTTMTNGTITFTASDALETAYSVTPSANNTVTAGDILYLTTAKTTAGGKALVSVTLTRTD